MLATVKDITETLLANSFRTTPYYRLEFVVFSNDLVEIIPKVGNGIKVICL